MHSTVGLVVPVGRLKAHQLFELAALARKHGSNPDDALRLTHQQNVVLPWIPNENVDALVAEPLVADLTPTPTLFQRGLQTCTGKEFCGLAKVHTKSRAVEIAKFLDEHVRPNGHGEDFRLHFAGCSSSCAQHQIADVGIEGVLKKVDGEFIEAMDIRIGGRLGENPQVRRRRDQEGPELGSQRHAAADLQPLRDQPRRRRDVPRLRGPHRARVVDERAHAGRSGMNVTEVLAQAVERHHPRLVMLCSFQKEESVLVDELVRIAPDARIVTIDTGVLFPETLATWRAFEERFGVDVEIEDATGDWTGPEHCCGAAQGRRRSSAR